MIGISSDQSSAANLNDHRSGVSQRQSETERIDQIKSCQANSDQDRQIEKRSEPISKISEKATDLYGVVSWDSMFERLLLYKEKHRNVNVPSRYTADPQLGKWVATQRRHHKSFMSKGMYRLDKAFQLTKERIDRLNELGFRWDNKVHHHVPWEHRYNELIQFKKRFGHTQVPIGWKENVKLGNWVSTQRQAFALFKRGKGCRLTADQRRRLDAIDFIWEAQRGGARGYSTDKCIPTDNARSTHPAISYFRETAGTIDSSNQVYYDTNSSWASPQLDNSRSFSSNSSTSAWWSGRNEYRTTQGVFIDAAPWQKNSDFAVQDMAMYGTDHEDGRSNMSQFPSAFQFPNGVSLQKIFQEQAMLPDYQPADTYCPIPVCRLLQNGTGYNTESAQQCSTQEVGSSLTCALDSNVLSDQMCSRSASQALELPHTSTGYFEKDQSSHSLSTDVEPHCLWRSLAGARVSTSAQSQVNDLQTNHMALSCSQDDSFLNNDL